MPGRRRPPPPGRRLLSALAYVFMAGGGVAASVWPSRSVSAATGALNALIMLWSAFLIVGGLCAAYGAWTDRWIGEYAGLPLLAAVFAVYGVSGLALARAAQWTSVAAGLAFLSVALAFMARWTEVASVRREAHDNAAAWRGGPAADEARKRTVDPGDHEGTG